MAEIVDIVTRGGQSTCGTEIVYRIGVTAATPVELGAAIFSEFAASMQGIAQAGFCNDYLSSSQFDRALETCDAALAIVLIAFSARTVVRNLDWRTPETIVTWANSTSSSPRPWGPPAPRV